MKNFDYLKELPLFTTLYTQCDRAYEELRLPKRTAAIYDAVHTV